MELLSTNSLTILAGTGLFFVLAMLLVIVLLVAKKYLKPDEFWFKGHFPQEPVQPGVLTIEMLAQTGAVCALCLPENKGKIAFFAGIDKARFRGKAGPGDTLTLEVEVIKTAHGISFCKGTATVDGKKIATAEFSSVLGD